MPTSDPELAKELRQARAKLARLVAEKKRLYPPTPGPLIGTRERFPRDYTPEQIVHRKRLVERIEYLEQLIGELEKELDL